MMARAKTKTPQDLKDLKDVPAPVVATPEPQPETTKPQPPTFTGEEGFYYDPESNYIRKGTITAINGRMVCLKIGTQLVVTDCLVFTSRKDAEYTAALRALDEARERLGEMETLLGRSATHSIQAVLERWEEEHDEDPEEADTDWDEDEDEDDD